MKIKCITLFDITETGVSGRRNTLDGKPESSSTERKQQINFETILQIISLRSQPEEITTPKKVKTNLNFWGRKGKTVDAWEFTFTVNYKSLFAKDSDPVGLLKDDCNGIPMITGLTEAVDPGKTLSAVDPINVHFGVEDDS